MMIGPPGWGKTMLAMRLASILPVRADDKILKVSRMIGDMEGGEEIRIEHLSEAIQYRALGAAEALEKIEAGGQQ